MKKTWMTMALALGLVAALTACSTEKVVEPITPDGSMDQSITANPGQTGYVGSGIAGGETGFDMNGVPGRATQRKTTPHRSAYDYLNEGKYDANGDGQVYGTGESSVRDFTQGARDMMRDAGNAVDDMGKNIGKATREMMNY